MLHTKIIISSLCLWLFINTAFAQTGFALRFQPQQVGATYWQPALLAQQQSNGGLQIGVDADYSLGTSSLPFNLLQFTDTYLEQGEKDRIIGELNSNNQLRAGFMLGAQAQFSLKGLPISLSYRRQQSIFFQVPSPQTLALVLNGNRPYAGTPITDENVRFQNLQWNEYGIGTAFSGDKLDFGFRLKLLEGKTFNQLQRLDYSFFTASDGTVIDISADYEAFSFDPNQGNWGVGLDLGLLYRASEKLQLGISANNISRIWWQGSQFENQVAFNYEGVEIGSLLNLNLNDINEFFVIDTVQALFVPDSTVGTFPAGVGGNIQVNAQYTLNNGANVWANVQYGFNSFADGGTLPFFGIGYQQQINKALLLGTHFYGGGIESFGWGLFGQYQFNWNENKQIALFLALDNSMGAILPTLGKGIRANGGLSINL